PLRELEFFLNEAAQVKALVTSLDLIAVHDVRGRAPRDGVDKGLAVRKQLPRLDLDKKLTVELGRAPRVLRGGGRRAVVTPIAIAALGTSLEALGRSTAEREKEERKRDPPRHGQTLRG